MDNVSIGYTLFTSPIAKPSHKLAICNPCFIMLRPRRTPYFTDTAYPEFTLRKQYKIHKNLIKQGRDTSFLVAKNTKLNYKKQTNIGPIFYKTTLNYYLLFKNICLYAVFLIFQSDFSCFAKQPHEAYFYEVLFSIFRWLLIGKILHFQHIRLVIY